MLQLVRDRFPSLPWGRGLAVTLSLLAISACLEPRLPDPPTPSPTDAGPTGCSPLTCTGCCERDQCLGGNERSACGYGGRACAPCSARTSCLSPGACIDDARDGGSFNTPPKVDGGTGAGTLLDPLTGMPLGPPRKGCLFLFGRFVCG
jgi:hypothetical protein